METVLVDVTDEISIHALTRSATLRDAISPLVSEISIHALTRSATLL